MLSIGVSPKPRYLRVIYLPGVTSEAALSTSCNYTWYSIQYSMCGACLSDEGSVVATVLAHIHADPDCRLFRWFVASVAFYFFTQRSACYHTVHRDCSDDLLFQCICYFVSPDRNTATDKARYSVYTALRTPPDLLSAELCGVIQQS